MYRLVLTCAAVMLICYAGFAQQANAGGSDVLQIELKNTSDSAGHCNKIKVLFKAPGADTVRICIRENKGGVPGQWYKNKSNPRAVDGDYQGLNESIDYDFKIEAVYKAGDKYLTLESEVLTRKKCR